MTYMHFPVACLDWGHRTYCDHQKLHWHRSSFCFKCLWGRFEASGVNKFPLRRANIDLTALPRYELLQAHKTHGVTIFFRCAAPPPLPPPSRKPPPPTPQHLIHTPKPLTGINPSYHIILATLNWLFLTHSGYYRSKALHTNMSLIYKQTCMFGYKTSFFYIYMIGFYCFYLFGFRSGSFNVYTIIVFVTCECR